MFTKTGKGKRRIYTPKYKAEVAKLCEQANQRPYTLAKDLGLTASAVRNWVSRVAVDRGKVRIGSVITAERGELRELRQALRGLRQARDILKRATSLFVKERTS
jgi:transposase